MVANATASSAPLHLDGASGSTAALWRVVGVLTAEQAGLLTHEINLLAAATTSPEQPLSQSRSRVAEGVRQRYSRWCPSRRGEACGCSPRWEAWVYSRKDRAKVRKTFSERWEAKAWRHEQLALAGVGLLRTPSRRTVSDVAPLWVTMARDGRIRNRSGRHYKPSALRAIEGDLRLHLLPSLGARRMAGVTRADLQRLVGTWLAEGLSPSKIRSIVNAARVLWRDFDLLIGHDEPLFVDPTRGLRLPASAATRLGLVRGRN